MSMRIAVVIPTLNEEESLERAIASARETDPEEIVVSDGGSRDRTLGIAEAAGVRVMTSERSRARQMNAAARSTQAGILLFLHADTVLPPGAGARIREALDGGYAFGGFRIRFTEDETRLFVAFPWHVGIFDREGKLVSELRGPAPPPQNVPLTGVLLLPKGRVLGVAKDAGSCPLWQGETRAGAVQSGGRIERAALSSDGKKMIVGAIGSVAMRWI